VSPRLDLPLGEWSENAWFSVHYLKRSGAVLGAGDVIARLTLDDPSRVKTVTSALLRHDCQVPHPTYPV